MAGRAEWLTSGLAPAEFRSLVRSGGLVRVWPGVYATRAAVEWAGVNPARGHALLASAARASVGRDSVISHESAAQIHGLDLLSAPARLVTLTRPPGRRSGRLRTAGILFRTAALPRGQVTQRLRATVTSVPRTVVDLARGSSFMAAVVTADCALHADLTFRGPLLAVCEACAGWPGIRQARRVVEFSDPRAESVLESCARVVFHERGLEPPELQHTVTGPDFRYSVDFYWPGPRVIAETDGAVKYADPRRAIYQLKRDQQLRDLGYKVVHFTWDDLFQNPRAVVERVSRAFAAPSAV